MRNLIRFIESIFHTFPAFILFSGLLMLPDMTGCDSGHISSESTISDYGEIREGEGQALSSINDFRENSILGPQHIDQKTYKLKISGLVEDPTEYSYDFILNNFNRFTKVLELNCVEGWGVKLLWEGILVRDLIEEAGPMDSAKVIIFHSYDGYSTSFPIEYFTRRDIMIAYKINEVTLPPERGFPFQLVAEDKWGYKWCKWITEIELSDNEAYLGYWESRGYSNDGSLSDCSPGPLSAQPERHPDRSDCCTCHSAP
jgi:DMSO/TMAO reductase YedYZ molybdopterin-dependent catalytic subunit